MNVMRAPDPPMMYLAKALAQYQMQLVRALRCDPAPTFPPNVCTYAVHGYSGGSGVLGPPACSFRHCQSETGSLVVLHARHDNSHRAHLAIISNFPILIDDILLSEVRVDGVGHSREGQFLIHLPHCEPLD